MKRKRGRPSNANRTEDNDEAEELEQPSAPKRRRGRPSNAHSENEAPIQSKKTRRRRTNAEILADREAEAKAKDTSTKRTRGRPSVEKRATQSQAEREPEDEAEQPVVKKRRRRRTNAEILADGQAQDEEVPKKKSKNRRSSDDNRKSSSQREPSASQNTHRKKARREDGIQPKETNKEDKIAKSEFQHMRPVTRQVPRDVIESKWSSLQTGATTRINDLLHDVARLVTMQIRDEKRRTQASAAIDSVIGRLGSKLRKGLPFPPVTGPHKEDEFNFEKVLDTTRALEAQLTPMLHSIKLLKAERNIEEHLLADDEANLEALEKNAKRAEQGRRQRSQKLHSLLQEDTPMKLDELEDQAGYLEEKSTPALTLDVRNLLSQAYEPRLTHSQISMDDELVPIVKQLNSHLESLENNLVPVEGLDSAMLRTRAAVDDVLYKHLNADQHEKVVGGG